MTPSADETSVKFLVELERHSFSLARLGRTTSALLLLAWLLVPGGIILANEGGFVEVLWGRIFVGTGMVVAAGAILSVWVHDDRRKRGEVLYLELRYEHQRWIRAELVDDETNGNVEVRLPLGQRILLREFDVAATLPLVGRNYGGAIYVVGALLAVVLGALTFPSFN